MNVNDCLSVEGNCNIANEQTGDVGLDISLKNVNQTHHLFSIDLSVGDLFVFCEKFALNREKIYCKSRHDICLPLYYVSIFSQFTKQLSTIRRCYP